MSTGDAHRAQHRVRLAGIYAPERKQPFIQQSRQLLSDLVLRKQVEVIAEKKDRYGRTLGRSPPTLDFQIIAG